MIKDTEIYPIYDLSNTHLRNAEITTDKDEIIKGEFVRFKVGDGNFEYLYPSERYCFLPREYKNKFWESYNSNGGVFKKMPGYMLHFGLNQIKKITIEPALF